MAGRCIRAALSTLLLTLALLLTPGVGVECFLCSYSPRSNTSRIDGCMDANFTEDQIELGSCELGCESVTIFDINEEMESFHRNCAMNDTIMTNTCETYTSMALTRRVCSCDFDYCNSSSSQQCTNLARVICLAMLLYFGFT